jgi:inorganic pyrophosphatase
MQNFIDLEPYGDNRQLRMIVETPRGSNIKLEYVSLS